MERNLSSTYSEEPTQTTGGADTLDEQMYWDTPNFQGWGGGPLLPGRGLIGMLQGTKTFWTAPCS